jgi:hypothetical protein
VIDNYILDGHTVVPEPDLMRWAEWMQANKYRYRRDDPEGMDPCRVGSDWVGEDWVSTTFLGIDHGWVEDAPPVVFETMIFIGGEDSEDCFRYSTWEEALSGHEHVVAWLQAGRPTEEPEFGRPLP